MEYVRTGLWQAILSGTLLYLVASACERLGRLFLSRGPFAIGKWTPLETRLFSLGIGFILLSLMILLIGLWGFLTVWAAGAVVLLCWLAGMLTPSRPSRQPGRAERSSPLQKVLYAFIALALFLSWIQTLVPPIENDGIAYHLVYSKQYLASGVITYIRHSLASLWPSQVEIFFTLGLLFQGTALAKAFHWVFYGMTALAVYAFGLRFFNRQAALFSMATFIFIPAAFVQSGQSYVDLALAFYVFMALYALFLSEPMGQTRAAWLSGILCGGALATKYLALGFAGILWLVWLARSRGRWKAPFYFAVACAVTAGIWYLRSWILIGNPLYPFFPSLFGGHGYEIRIIDGMGKGPVDFLLLLWNMTLSPGPFGGELLGPLFLMFLPFLLVQAKKAGPTALTMTVFTVLGTLFLFSQSQQVRYLLALAPLLCLGVGVALDHLCQKNEGARRIALAAFFSVLLLHSGLFAYRSRQAWSALTGTMDDAAYLSAHERSFRGYQVLNEQVKPDQKVFNFSEIRRFYQGNYTMVMDMPALRIELQKEGLTLEEYVKRQRFDYLWANPGVLSGPLGPWIREYYDEVFSYEFTETPATFRYTILRLRGTLSGAV